PLRADGEVFDDRGFVPFDRLPGASDRVLLFGEELLDAEDEVDVLAPVDALAGAVLLGRELRELALPEPQDVGLGVGDLTDFRGLVVELVGDRFRLHARSIAAPRRAGNRF